MRLFSYSTFSVARIFMALAVFFCHVFQSFNYFGFLFVGVFFFMSGYGMEVKHLCSRSLTRLIPLIFLFAFCSFCYWIRFHVFLYPSSWFFVVYFVLMLFYRFVSDLRILTILFVLFAFFFYFLQFSWPWEASFGGFLFGVFFARYPSYFTLRNCFILVPLILFLQIFPFSVFLWFLLPLFSFFVFSLSSLSFFRLLIPLAPYTVLFYCFHCFFLGLFKSTWTLGGSPSFSSVLCAFLFTIVACIIFYFFFLLFSKFKDFKWN